MKMDFKKIILGLISALLLSSCIKLKEDYPSIDYYSLQLKPIQIEKLGQVEGALLIRNFNISSEYETDHILVTWDDNRVQRYYYHRWLTNFNNMATDFVTMHINQVDIFSEGAISGSSLVIPDFVMEGKIMEMITFNSAKGQSYVQLTVNARLMQRNIADNELAIKFNKIYTQRINRQNSQINNVAEAYSKALSLITQMIILDIGNSIEFEED